MADVHTKQIMMFGQPATLACDGNCAKAWGIQLRPREQLNPNDEDDDVMLADGELDEAPLHPGTWEGVDTKPAGPHDMNRWCSRECERAVLAKPGEAIALPDFSTRRYNKPWLHGGGNG